MIRLVLAISCWILLASLAPVICDEPSGQFSRRGSLGTASQTGENLNEHQCRFWGMIADSLPEDVVLDHLINSPYSLKNLGETNDDGWGLAYYDGSEPVVARGLLPAKTDHAFDTNAAKLAETRARIGVGHVRLAASGTSGIPNPHPFIRHAGGSWWAFGHNGVLSKATLRDLIGEEYLSDFSPAVGDNWSDPRVVDSDLYMLYILKCIEDKDWNATEGIAQAVRDISRADFGAMNFFLTDGETLWGFRKGNTLYYYSSETAQYSAIASQPPDNTQDSWIALSDYSLIMLTENKPPQVLENVTAIPEGSSLWLPSLFATTALLVAAILLKKRTGTRKVL